METRKFLIDYLRGSPSSPYYSVDAIFMRDEYQEFSGNLPHIHLMLSMKLKYKTEDQKERIDNVIRASVGNIVKSEEVDEYIKEGIFKSYNS